jgi:hypothetical protein
LLVHVPSGKRRLVNVSEGEPAGQDTVSHSASPGRSILHRAPKIKERCSLGVDGGADVDSDQDAMGIRIAAAEPESGTMAILGAGLVALGSLRACSEEAVSSPTNRK